MTDSKKEAQEKQAFVYIISHKDISGTPCAPIKIGVTTNLTARLIGLQIGNPQEIDFFAKFIFPTEERAYWVERKLHAYFADERLQGEWFNVEPQDVMSKYMLYSSYEIESHRESIIDKAEFACGMLLAIARHSYVIESFIKSHKNGWSMYKKFNAQACQVHKESRSRDYVPPSFFTNPYDEAEKVWREYGGEAKPVPEGTADAPV